MYKTLSDNLVRRAFRSAGRSRSRPISLKETRQIIAIKRAQKFRNAMQTEPELIAMLGEGPEFVRRIYSKYYRSFKQQRFDPRRCAAYLNHIAKSKMMNGALWTDKATESMFRRTRIKRRTRHDQKLSRPQ